MTTVLIFDETETQEAVEAIQAGQLKSAAFFFDQELRNKMKYGELSEAEYQVYESIRELHRKKYEEMKVSFEE